jgi:hypothetical protein
MDRTFAGFWRDGAEVQPEGKHFDSDCMIIAKHKDTKELDICNIVYKGWESVYWLDTTTPTELSPQEAFELLKVINPDTEKIEDDSGNWVSINPGSDIINWGNTTEYPSKQCWRVPTDADKGKKCRVSNDNDCLVMERTFIARFNGVYIVANNEHKITCWNYCEVLDS